MERIKKVQDILLNLIAEIQKLVNISKIETDKETKALLKGFAIYYCYLNMIFSQYLLRTISNSYRKDVIDKEFFKIIKPLQNGFKKKRKNGNGKK